MHIVMNLMSAEKEICEKIVNSPLFEILLAFSKVDDPERASVKITAERCLEKAVEWKLIEATPEGQEKEAINKEMLALLMRSFYEKKKKAEAAAKAEADKPQETGASKEPETVEDKAQAKSKPTAAESEAMEKAMLDPKLQQAMMESGSPEQVKLARMMAALKSLKQDQTENQSEEPQAETDQSEQPKPDISQLEDSKQEGQSEGVKDRQPEGENISQSEQPIANGGSRSDAQNVPNESNSSETGASWISNFC